MGKKKLSKGQQRRVTTNLQRRLTLPATADAIADEQGELQAGIVIGRFGKQADVESSQPPYRQQRCHIRRTIDSVVTGDRVVWRATTEGEPGIIEAVHPRQNLLTRPDHYDGLKVVAANIDQVVIISACLPTFSSNIVDRYLINCELLNISPILVLNKIDLLTEQQAIAIQQQLEGYQQLGYAVFYTSHLTEAGIATLSQALVNKTNIFVGQSGVGKSSLLNSLLADSGATIAVGEVSRHSGLGQHTTTASRLYHLQQGGHVIDSPGIREFGLWHLTIAQINQGYREFLPYLNQCKFRDCLHQHEPGCAIVEAVKKGDISQQRFDNYHKIIASIDQPSTRKFSRKRDQ